MGKSELHAWGGAPHTTIRLVHQGRSYKLSTINEQGEPHSHYKYLGVYFFTDYAPTVMLAHYLPVVDDTRTRKVLGVIYRKDLMRARRRVVEETEESG